MSLDEVPIAVDNAQQFLYQGIGPGLNAKWNKWMGINCKIL
jgi:hypothetical protein